MLLEISREITPERMKGWSQSKNNAQLWMGRVIEARSDAVKSNMCRNLECQVHESDEPWTEVCDIVQEKGIKTIPMEKKCKKAKWLSEEALQIAVKKREAKSKGEKERYSHLNAEF